MKVFFRAIIITLLCMFLNTSPSSALGPLVQIIPPGAELHPGMTKSEFKICQVRRLFCGKAGVAIVAFAVFLMGIMIINNKLAWTTGIVLIAGIIIFINPYEVSKTVGRETFLIFLPNPMCDCNCNIEHIESCVQ